MELNFFDESLIFENKIRHLSNKHEIVEKASKNSKLKYVNLRKSRLDYIPEFASKEIEFLDLSCNNLTQFPLWILKLENLKFLNIGSNDIFFVPSLKHMNLETLKIYKNKIFDIELCKSIKFLNLYLNNFETFPKQVFELEKLEFLSYCDCKLKIFPKELCDLHSLKWLCFVSNKIENLPDNFVYLKNLIGIKFGKNNIKELPLKFGDLSNLKEISFYCNKLTELPDSFFNLNLNKLNMSKNKLTEECLFKLYKYSKIEFYSI